MIFNTSLISLDANQLLAAFKRAAKHAKKTEKPPQHQLSWHQDKVAKHLGYLNWSQLHKHATSASSRALGSLRENASNHPELSPFMVVHMILNEDEAREEIRSYAFSNFSPLHDFALYDSESETGYAWPDIDLSDELQEQFSDRYPSAFVYEVAMELLSEYGPWGVEEFGQDD